MAPLNGNYRRPARTLHRFQKSFRQSSNFSAPRHTPRNSLRLEHSIDQAEPAATGRGALFTAGWIVLQ